MFVVLLPQLCRLDINKHFKKAGFLLLEILPTFVRRLTTIFTLERVIVGWDYCSIWKTSKTNFLIDYCLDYIDVGTAHFYLFVCLLICLFIYLFIYLFMYVFSFFFLSFFLPFLYLFSSFVCLFVYFFAYIF